MADFVATISDWVDQTETDAADALRKICLDIYTGVLIRTRVDTGRLRGSWRMNIGSADTTVLNADEDPPAVSDKAPPTGTEFGYALGVTAQIELGDLIVISNSLPYAQIWNDEDSIVDDTVGEVLANLEEALAEVRAVI